MGRWVIPVILLLFSIATCLGWSDNISDGVPIFVEDICIEEPNFKKLPNPFDEHGYLQCYKGQTLEKACPGKQIFDNTIQKCHSVKKIQTEVKKEVSNEPKQAPVNPFYAKKKIRMVRDTHLLEQISCKDQPNWTMLPDPESCENYFVCIHEVPEKHTCDPGDYYEAKKKICVPSRDSTCTPKAPEGFCDAILNFQKLESPNNCGEYYMCVNSIAYYYRCPEYKWFDFESQTCKTEKSIECSIINPPEPPDKICVGVANFEYVSSPYNCQDYYQCIFEIPYFKHCPDNKWFDEEKQSCEDPKNTKCDVKHLPAKMIKT